MFKRSRFLLTVDSVESAIKFYTEKLLFSVTFFNVESGPNPYCNYAELRRGKCFLVFRLPNPSELAEFSMIRRMGNRGSGLFLELKGGIEDFLDTCKKKRVSVVSEITKYPNGYIGFVVADPFGIRLHFVQKDPAYAGPDQNNLNGMKITDDQKVDMKKGKSPQVIIDYLKSFGLSRRVAKKYMKYKFGGGKEDSE